MTDSPEQSLLRRNIVICCFVSIFLAFFLYFIYESYSFHLFGKYVDGVARNIDSDMTEFTYMLKKHTHPVPFSNDLRDYISADTFDVRDKSVLSLGMYTVVRQENTLWLGFDVSRYLEHAREHRDHPYRYYSDQRKKELFGKEFLSSLVDVSSLSKSPLWESDSIKTPPSLSDPQKNPPKYRGGATLWRMIKEENP